MANTLAFLFLHLARLLYPQAVPQPAPVYTSWVVGDTADVQTRPLGGVVLAGGSTDVDAAMRWFLQRAAGGDVLVLRSSGKDGYNEYLYQKLGVSVNSVETIMLDNRQLSTNTDIIRKIRNAEAIFLAGGDQGNYVNFWPGTPIADALNERIRAGAVLGGTSAGCGILGQVYFTAKEGTVTSAEALANPYDKRVDLRRDDFLKQPLLANTITDMHYAARERQGRHLVFMARAFTDWGLKARGIGVDEKTAVCIAPDGHAIVFGKGNAYFLKAGKRQPEICQVNQPLTWNRKGKAVSVTTVIGSEAGTSGFDLTTFQLNTKSATAYWFVETGVKR
ncbi:cyanophycinase [Spirosoma linguale]|uniref:Cyanophycinase-like protein n=1 Tax=Spirosoma linguale (strain ATCC 33905 / DSM 74 / LMG 10896 / Claus 1) TaxID=504472 RepID=D2QKM7_SPILD|nr:cyanophycinase-like protein [Spirosoma linguale DSM 74]